VSAVTVFANLDELQAGAAGTSATAAGWGSQPSASRSSPARREQARTRPAPWPLALSNYLLSQIIEVGGISMGINYGANQIRW
jgi:hypothetical protein